MTIKFRHKDQEFFEEICKLLPSFAKRFQEECKAQWDAHYSFISVGRDRNETFHWYFRIPKKDIEQVEDLKPFVWYPASKWNGNPEQYTLIERVAQGDTYLFRGMIRALTAETEFFMFAPRDKDIKPKC